MIGIQLFLYNFFKMKGFYKYFLYIDERNYLWKGFYYSYIEIFISYFIDYYLCFYIYY